MQMMGFRLSLDIHTRTHNRFKFKTMREARAFRKILDRLLYSLLRSGNVATGIRSGLLGTKMRHFVVVEFDKGHFDNIRTVSMAYNIWKASKHYQYCRGKHEK